MNEQLARSLFMDYLYDEIEDEDKQKLESYLSAHPELQKELEEFQQTCLFLQQMPAPEPAQKLLMMEPEKRSFRQWWKDAGNLFPKTVIGKTGFALAASLILFFFIGSAARFNISFSDNGTSITLGYTPVINEGLTQQEAQTLLQQIREENAALLSGYAQTMAQQNNEQLQQVVRYFEQQRYNDLQLVNQSLNQVQQASSYRWQQTNQFLGEVLQTVKLDNTY